ncbi:MAG TPA: hypothetical protein VFX03_15205 [Thermomicrobiales bacterium]|nr:hypothetical protein [Thermomicrobiales bacterium]
MERIGITTIANLGCRHGGCWMAMLRAEDDIPPRVPNRNLPGRWGT